MDELQEINWRYDWEKSCTDTGLCLTTRYCKNFQSWEAWCNGRYIRNISWHDFHLSRSLNKARDRLIHKFQKVSRAWTKTSLIVHNFSSKIPRKTRSNAFDVELGTLCNNGDQPTQSRSQIWNFIQRLQKQTICCHARIHKRERKHIPHQSRRPLLIRGKFQN